MDSGPSSSRRRKGQTTRAANHLLQGMTLHSSQSGQQRRHDNYYYSERKQRSHQEFDRGLFLRANYRFGVCPSRGSNAGVDVEWEDVIILEMISSTIPRCPISLEEVELPYITPCGHVFSLVSVVTHMLFTTAEGMKGTSPCPLCGVQMIVKEIRPIQIRVLDKKAGLDGKESAEFRLVWRRRNSSEVVPVRDTTCDTGCYPVVMPQFCRMMVVENPLDLWLFIADRLVEMSESVRLEGGQEAAYLLPGYLAAIEAVIGHCRMFDEKEWVEALEERVAEGMRASQEAEEDRERMKRLDEEFPSLSVSNLNFRPKQKGKKTNVVRCSVPDVMLSQVGPHGEDMYLYQKSDGQWIFLNTLNMKMLHLWKGGYEDLPECICARVVEVEEYTQTEQMQRKLRLFSHIPPSATFYLCEVDLSDIVSDDVMEEFRDELVKRKEKRVLAEKQRAREEKKRQRKKTEPLPFSLADMPRLTPCDQEKQEDERGIVNDDESASGLNYAQLCKLGFAATGPSLGGAEEMPPLGDAPAWIIKKDSGNVEARSDKAPSQEVAKTGSRKKKATKQLLFSTSQRQY